MTLCYFELKSKLTLSKIVKYLRHQMLIKVMDRYTIWLKKRSGRQKISYLDVPSHTVEHNRRLWENYDWSNSGEEWTLEAKTYRRLEPKIWKTSLINEMMLKYIKKDSIILEIGPGAGRWSEILQNVASHLILADISQRCLELCKERFKNYKHIQYNLVERGLDFIPNDSIDYIWSYDVFVHINPTDIEMYITDFQRTLKPGGHAIIHHSGQYSSEKDAREKGFRSYMDGNLFAYFVRKHEMQMIEQNHGLAHIPGDIISVFMKPLL